MDGGPWGWRLLRSTWFTKPRESGAKTTTTTFLFFFLHFFFIQSNFLIFAPGYSLMFLSSILFFPLPSHLCFSHSFSYFSCSFNSPVHFILFDSFILAAPFYPFSSPLFYPPIIVLSVFWLPSSAYLPICFLLPPFFHLTLSFSHFSLIFLSSPLSTSSCFLIPLHEVALMAIKVANDPHLFPYHFQRMVNRGDGKKTDTYGPPGSRHHVNKGLKQQ